MTLVQSWIDSVQLFKPKNLQLFILVTIKSIIDAYKLMFKYFWWLIAIYLVCYSYVFTSLYPVFVAMGLQQLLFFMLCAITRPSIVKKDCAYFRAQLYPFAYFVAFWALLIAVGYFSGIAIPQVVQLLPFFIWTVFSMLFFLDSEKNVKSFGMSLFNALKMMLFNLPAVMVLYAGLYFFDTTIMWCADQLFALMHQGWLFLAQKYEWMRPALMVINKYNVFTMLYVFIRLLLMPVGICIYANIYIKKLHDQFDLYVKQPQ